MLDQDDTRNDPKPRSPTKEKRSDKILLPERGKDTRERDHSKTHPYRLHICLREKVKSLIHWGCLQKSVVKPRHVD